VALFKPSAFEGDGGEAVSLGGVAMEPPPVPGAKGEGGELAGDEEGDVDGAVAGVGAGTDGAGVGAGTDGAGVGAGTDGAGVGAGGGVVGAAGAGDGDLVGWAVGAAPGAWAKAEPAKRAKSIKHTKVL
jgi:hypothetical protein